MKSTSHSMRVGLYIDVANLARNGGYGMQFDVLREFACRDDSEAIRLNAYVTYDKVRAQHDFDYLSKQQGFFSVLRDFGYKVIRKEVKWYFDEDGNRYGKANADLDLAVDALMQSEKLDRVILATGDGDFVQVVRALQDKGCRVEIVAFDNVSVELRNEADTFVSGYLIPNLLRTPSSNGSRSWGETGSRVRGVCYRHLTDYGFLRFLNGTSSALWRTDTRCEGSPYASAYFHDAGLPNEVSPAELPSRDIIFEFKIEESHGHDQRLKATHIRLISPQR